MAEEQGTPAANQEQTVPAPAETAPQTNTDEADKPIINNDDPAKQDGDKPLMGGEEDEAGDGGKDKAPDGAPETYEAFTMPEGFSFDEGRMNETTALFKELNLSQGNAQKLIDAYCKYAQEQQKSEADFWMNKRKEWRSEIRSREDFREQNALMRKGFHMLVKTDAQKRLFTDSWLQDSPELFDLFVAAGKLAAEDTMSAPSHKANPTEAEINMQRFPNL